MKIELTNIQAVTLCLYLESIRENINRKDFNNINEQLFLAAEKAFNDQIPFSSIQDSVIEEVDMLHEIYNQKKNN